MLKTLEELGIDRSQFKDEMGRFITQGLFPETPTQTDKARCVYTLKPYDHTYHGRFLPSLKLIYLELEDPTEYLVATEYLGGWEHWQRLIANKFLRNFIDGWRAELEVKLRAKAIRTIVEESTSSSKGALQAAKWLADKGWKPHTRGAPSKEEKEGLIKEIERVHSEMEDDFERIQSPLKII